MKQRYVPRALMIFLSAAVLVVSALMWANAQTMHVILVGDTKDPNIGYGDKLDLDLMRNLVQEAAKSTGMQLKMKIFDDKIPRADIMNAVKNLNPGSDDAVVFFYTGHGYRMSTFKEKWPAMALQGPYGGSAGLDLKWAYDILKKQNPRFLLVMADCCNSIVPAGSIDTHLSVAYGETNPQAYKKLFKEHKGSILASSSIPGQYSYSGNTGSQFTVQFINSLKGELSGGNPTWKSIMTKSVRPIMGGKQQPMYVMDAKADIIDGQPSPYKDEDLYKNNNDKTQPDNTQFGQLMITMESHIPYNAQTKQWMGMRPQWIQRVLSSEGNLAKMKEEMVLFEKHILWNAQKNEWKQQRQVWMGKVQSAGSMAQLANPLIEVEGSMKDGVFISLWSKERPAWMEKMKSISGGSGGQDQQTDNKDNKYGGGGTLGKLLAEFEDSVIDSAKSEEWAGARSIWNKDAMNAGNNLQKLQQLILDFESHIEFAYQVNEWPVQRKKWEKKALSVSSLNQLKNVLLEVEQSMKQNGLKQSWAGRKTAWRNEVNSIK